MEMNEQTLAQLQSLARDPAARQLIRMLQRAGGSQLEDAVASAARGDYTQAQKTLSALLEDPEAKKLLEQLGR